MSAIGIDIGGTQLRAAVFDGEWQMLERFAAPNDREQGARENARKLVEFVRAHREGCRGIGIGCPGPLDFARGLILNPPNLYGWDGFEIVRYFEEETGIPTRLNNDANVAGLAEALRGAGQGYESVFYLTVSTGVGGAFVYRGELLNGANSSAAEVFNLIVNEDAYCHKGANPGSLNEQCGGHAIARIASRRFGRAVTAPELFALWRAGDALAEELTARCAENLAKGIANIACVVDPEVFVVGGSIALRNPDFVERIRQRAKRYLLHPETFRLLPAALGGDAGLTGAALLFREG